MATINQVAIVLARTTLILVFRMAENAGADMIMELDPNIYKNPILHVVVLRVMEAHGATLSTKHVLI